MALLFGDKLEKGSSLLFELFMLFSVSVLFGKVFDCCLLFNVLKIIVVLIIF